ncbi:MAG: hypothetical protein IK139_02750 [Lachnospiraceae bacterium]|nr:hypothetical protein [Lachnospiraceae bacterium]
MEYNTTENELLLLGDKLREYPKGSIRTRKIKGKDYYYLQFRDGKHIRSQYVPENEVNHLMSLIEERKKLEKRIAEMTARVNSYAKLIGIHRTYRPVKNVDYNDYTLFMSSVAHDYKSMSREAFIAKYDVSKYRGLNKRYLAGFFDYISGADRKVARKTNDLVLDPYTYLMYYKYNDKEALTEGLKRAIPAFLCRGLLITDVQEAVNVTQSGTGIPV